MNAKSKEFLQKRRLWVLPTLQVWPKVSGFRPLISGLRCSAEYPGYRANCSCVKKYYLTVLTWFLRSQNAPKSKFSGAPRIPLGVLTARCPSPKNFAPALRPSGLELRPFRWSRFYGSQGLMPDFHHSVAVLPLPFHHSRCRCRCRCRCVSFCCLRL